ncbi:hypothetical protein [Streptomyces sp. NPDC001568]|uniref:hypothetical protein n=1 Tax=Streptomyces sp. NPDC001568 TaxID=3364588 RepID=UPI0036893DC9
MSATNATKATHAANATNAASTRSAAGGSTAAAGSISAAPTTGTAARSVRAAELDAAVPVPGSVPVHHLNAPGAANASKRLGLGLLGALLAGGLLLAACSVPDDRPPAPDPGDVVLPHQGGTRK